MKIKINDYVFNWEYMDGKELAYFKSVIVYWHYHEYINYYVGSKFDIANLITEIMIKINEDTETIKLSKLLKVILEEKKSLNLIALTYDDRAHEYSINDVMVV